MAEITIAGRKVVLRERFRAGDSLAIVAGWANMYPVGKVPFAEQVGPMMPVVEAWEFDGDPQSLEAWADLDAFEQFLPLWGEISKHLASRYDAQQAHAKN